MPRLRKWAHFVALIIMGGSFLCMPAAHAQGSTRTFPETGQSISGRFLDYWTQNGGLLQQGYPISPEMQEQSATDGKTYTVQYFERSVFELHPENQAPDDVLLSLLGVMTYNQKYPNGAPNQVPNVDPGSQLFPDTGKRIGGTFQAYFNAHGGVRQQGLPISDEFQEVSALDGKMRTVQYFQRAVFEWNPSNDPPYNVLLSQLGTFAYKAKTGQPLPQPVPQIQEPAIPGPHNASKGEFAPLVSDRYLLWYEGYPSGNSDHPSFNDLDIYGLDLRTNKPITVTTNSGNQTQLALDGSLVAWFNDSLSCVECNPEGIYAKDLGTGTTYKVALTGAGIFPATPAVADRTVAWVQDTDTARQIVAKNLETGNTISVRSIDPKAISISGLIGSGRFLAWREWNMPAVGTTTGASNYTIQAYDLATNKLIEVLTAPVTSGADFYLPALSLSGTSIAVSINGSVFVQDLLTGVRKNLVPVGRAPIVSLFGDTLLFSTNDIGSDLYAVNVTDAVPSAVQLLKSPSDRAVYDPARYQAVIVGDWLVWSDGSRTATLQHKKLDLTR